MTTEEVINKIFEENDHMTDYEEVIHLCMSEYARIKCLEAIRNVRHKTIEIIQDESYHTGAGFAECNVEDTIKRIQNIPNKEVMPEL